MSMMQEAAALTRKRVAEQMEEMPKRMKAEVKESFTLTEMLSRKATTEPQMPVSQNSDNSTDSLARFATQQKVTRSSKSDSLSRTNQPKAQEQESSSTMEQGGTVFVLSKKRHVTVRKWKTMTFVDIREFYDNNGEAKPGKRGISLSLDQWEKLYGYLDAISEAIKLVEENTVDNKSLSGIEGCILQPNGDLRAVALPLSPKRRVTIRYFNNAVLIDLREYYDQDGLAKPGKKGISLSKDQWIALRNTADEIFQTVDLLKRPHS
ncbi:putative transcriptional coactivator p15 (PC4), ssDNA-binding transcriptional regulator [Plasmopara halstedii]